MAYNIRGKRHGSSRIALLCFRFIQQDFRRLVKLKISAHTYTFIPVALRGNSITIEIHIVVTGWITHLVA